MNNFSKIDIDVNVHDIGALKQHHMIIDSVVNVIEDAIEVP